MLELDMPVTNGECYFCEHHFEDGIDEHEETCPFPVGLELSESERIDFIYSNRLDRLSNNFHNIFIKLLRNEPIPVKTELGPDFCINCTSLEQHSRDNCLMMSRNQAFEAIFPSLQFKMFQLCEDFNIAFKHSEEEELSESLERRKAERQDAHNACIGILRNVRASSRLIRRIEREYRRMCIVWDDEAKQKQTSVAEDCQLKYREELQMCATQCQELLACYKSLILEIERDEPRELMIRFVSTYNPEDRQQTEPLKLFLYEDNE